MATGANGRPVKLTWTLGPVVVVVVVVVMVVVLMRCALWGSEERLPAVSPSGHPAGCNTRGSSSRHTWIFRQSCRNRQREGTEKCAAQSWAVEMVSVGGIDREVRFELLLLLRLHATMWAFVACSRCASKPLVRAKRWSVVCSTGTTPSQSVTTTAVRSSCSVITPHGSPW